MPPRGRAISGLNMISAENAPDGVNLASARTWPLTSISTTPDAKICIAGKNAIKIKPVIFFTTASP